MNDDELLAEIRALREDIKELSKEFYIFKGKAFGFMSVLVIVFNIGLDFIKRKIL